MAAAAVATPPRRRKSTGPQGVANAFHVVATPLADVRQRDRQLHAVCTRFGPEEMESKPRSVFLCQTSHGNEAALQTAIDDGPVVEWTDNGITCFFRKTSVELYLVPTRPGHRPWITVVKCQGFISKAGASACEACALGYYAPEAGLSECLPCQLGHAANTTGRSVCSSCPAGTFGFMGLCQDHRECPVGSFQAVPGQSSCKEDGLGQRSSTPGTVLPGNVPGFYAIWAAASEDEDLRRARFVLCLKNGSTGRQCFGVLGGFSAGASARYKCVSWQLYMAIGIGMAVFYLAAYTRFATVLATSEEASHQLYLMMLSLGDCSAADIPVPEAHVNQGRKMFVNHCASMSVLLSCFLRATTHGPLLESLLSLVMITDPGTLAFRGWAPPWCEDGAPPCGNEIFSLPCLLQPWRTQELQQAFDALAGASQVEPGQMWNCSMDLSGSFFVRYSDVALCNLECPPAIKRLLFASSGRSAGHVGLLPSQHGTAVLDLLGVASLGRCAAAVFAAAHVAAHAQHWLKAAEFSSKVHHQGLDVTCGAYAPEALQQIMAITSPIAKRRRKKQMAENTGLVAIGAVVVGIHCWNHGPETLSMLRGLASAVWYDHGGGNGDDFDARLEDAVWENRIKQHRSASRACMHLSALSLIGRHISSKSRPPVPPHGVALGQTSGVTAAGAWAARWEIATLLEEGCEVSELVAAIRSGREGRHVLDEEKPPWASQESGSKAASPAAGAAKEHRPPYAREEEESTFARKAVPPPIGVMAKLSSGVPVPPSPPAKKASDANAVEEHAAFPKPAVPPPRSPSGSDRRNRRSRREGHASRERSRRRRRGTGATSMKEKERLDLDKFHRESLSIYRELKKLKVHMELTDIVEKDGSLDVGRFQRLTAPNKAATGLNYTRLMSRLLEWRSKQNLSIEEGASFDSHMNVLEFTEHLVQTECGYLTPRSFMYALDFFATAFGYGHTGGRWNRAKRLAASYAASKSTPVNRAPGFTRATLWALEAAVLDRTLTKPERVACGKLRLCIQSSTRFDDILNTPVVCCEWVRRPGEKDI
eukprot:s2693_g1.t1